MVAAEKKVGQIFKCQICGNVVEVKEAGGGELVFESCIYKAGRSALFPNGRVRY